MAEPAIRAFEDGDLAAVAALWDACALTQPHNDPARDIAFCRTAVDAVLFVAEHSGRVVATVMAGHDGHRGWLYYAAVDPAHRGRGLGRRMVAHAEEWLARRGAPKVNLMIRDTNEAARGFWEAVGYRAEPRTVMARFLDAAGD